MSHFVARHLLFEKSILSSKCRYRLAKWVMPKFRFTKSKILIELAGPKSIDSEDSFRLRFGENEAESIRDDHVHLLLLCIRVLWRGEAADLRDFF